DAASFEAAARENLTAELYGSRTPAQRAQTIQRLSGDFGRMVITALTIEGARGRADVRGQTGLNGVLVFTFDGTPENRIANITVEVRPGGGPAHAGGPNVPTPPLRPDMSPSEMSAAIDSWIAPFVAHDDFAGVVLIARDGKPHAVRALGPADRARSLAADNDTTFNVASIGKRFTQTAIARLVQEGRIGLDSTIGQLLPDYPNAEAHGATIDQLIRMQGGIADIFAPERASIPRSRLASNHDYFNFVSSLPQRFAPGAKEEYCNGCYVVLGEIVERVSGMRFEDYIQRVVFAPAGMKRTGYFRTDRLPPNTAIAYQRANGPGSPYVDATEQEGLAGSGAGGLYSTAGDLLAFDNALRDGRLLDAKQSGWVLGGSAMDGRNTTPLAIQGGGPGVSAVLYSDGHWSVIVTSNVSRPLPFQIAAAIARALRTS
ncbi:MAG: serine hydrolase domain-containing protein, partial [Steroidobacteraceae bacterium]